MESSDFSFSSIETNVFQGRIEDTSRDLGPQAINQAFSFNTLLGSSHYTLCMADPYVACQVSLGMDFTC